MKHYNVIAYQREYLDHSIPLTKLRTSQLVSQGYRLYNSNYMGYNNGLRSILKKLLINLDNI